MNAIPTLRNKRYPKTEQLFKSIGAVLCPICEEASIVDVDLASIKKHEMCTVCWKEKNK